MARRMRALALTAALAALPAAPALALSEWPTWSAPVGGVSTASFADGRTAQFTGTIIAVAQPGAQYAATPAIPGQADGLNPSFLFTSTGESSPIAPGDVILTLDLGGFPIDAETTIGFADVFDIRFYRLELLDGASSPLSLTGLQLDSYNLSYPGSGVVADRDILLDTTTGALSVSPVHDAGTGSGYSHSGLTTFTGLPDETRFVRLVSTASQNTEGVQFYFGGSASVPEPGSGALLLLGLAGTGVARRRRRPRPRRAGSVSG